MSKHPYLVVQIKESWFDDLREQAADDTTEDRIDLAKSGLIDHESVRITQHYFYNAGRKQHQQNEGCGL